MHSRQVQVRKGLFTKSLTTLLQPYIHGAGLRASAVQIPAGRFHLEMAMAAMAGAKTLATYRLEGREPSSRGAGGPGCATLSPMTADRRVRAPPLPVGKTDEQLNADSDVVAEVLVVAVTFLGEAENTVGGHDQSYEAGLRVLKVIRGPSAPPTAITSSWTAHVPPRLGSQTVPCRQGERALAIWRGKKRTGNGLCGGMPRSPSRQRAE
jgi:hypothetical protein